jgi:hypothetical protein
MCAAANKTTLPAIRQVAGVRRSTETPPNGVLRPIGEIHRCDRFSNAIDADMKERESCFTKGDLRTDKAKNE